MRHPLSAQRQTRSVCLPAKHHFPLEAASGIPFPHGPALFRVGLAHIPPLQLVQVISGVGLRTSPPITDGLCRAGMSISLTGCSQCLNTFRHSWKTLESVRFTCEYSIDNGSKPRAVAFFWNICRDPAPTSFLIILPGVGAYVYSFVAPTFL